MGSAVELPCVDPQTPLVCMARIRYLVLLFEYKLAEPFPVTTNGVVMIRSNLAGKPTRSRMAGVKKKSTFCGGNRLYNVSRNE